MGLCSLFCNYLLSNSLFTSSYLRAEILAGFVNGLFLVFVAFFIFKEAIERALEPPEVKHDRLMVISVLGFLVNLVGIFVFQHGGSHGHSHGGGGHDHSDHGHSHNHSNHHHENSHSHQEAYPQMGNYMTPNHNDPHSYIMNGQNSYLSPSPSPPASHHHSHSHSHSHNGHGGSSSHIMKGVFLHILADTLGSVGVIVSAFLMSQFGWMIADPICSMFIAIMILISVYPLLRESSAILMQRSPIELDNTLPDCFRKVSKLDIANTIV